jgi:hypothetical protein
MSCRKGDRVTARRQIDGMNVPEVPPGTDGTVVKTTLLGRPKQVQFVLQTARGPKRFVVSVQRGDVTS